MALQKSMKYGAGRRSKYLELQRGVDSKQPGSFEVVPDFNHLCFRFGEEAMSSGREFQMALQTYAMLSGIFRIRFDKVTATLTARDRIKVVESGRLLYLAAPPINEGGNNEVLILYVSETPQYTPPN